MHRPALKEMAPQLHLEAWPDAVVEQVGHDPRGAYAHEFWLPLLGPSSLLVTRKLLDRMEAAGGRCTIDTAELAVSVGLGASVGRNSRIATTFARLAGFGLLHVGPTRDDDAAVAVRTAWAPLSRSQALRLPPSLLERLSAA